MTAPATDVRAIDAAGLAFAPAPAAPQPFRVFIDEAVFDHAVARGNADMTREVGGVLLGALATDEHGPYLRIDGHIDALHADEKSTELTFTHDTWTHINRELDTTFAGQSIVGWWHTHPGFGVFLSDRDQFIQRSFFDEPFQIAFVYDPTTREHGVFTWRDDEAVRTRQYWVGGRAHDWDGDRPRTVTRPSSAKSATSADTPSSSRSPSSPSSPSEDIAPEWGSFALIAAVAVVAVLAVLWWLRPSSPADASAAARTPSLSTAAAGPGSIAELEVELVRMWRQTMDQSAIAGELDAVMELMDRAEAAMSSPSDAASAASAHDHLAQARARVARLRSGHEHAAAMLAAVEAGAARRSTRDVDLVRELAAYRVGLANLYAEMAAQAIELGQTERASRLLVNATRLDPASRERHDALLRKAARPGQGAKNR